eukprot:SAG11_NODE_1687_length_4448_cov_3.035640_2_plen_234_part_00
MGLDNGLVRAAELVSIRKAAEHVSGAALAAPRSATLQNGAKMIQYPSIGDLVSGTSRSEGPAELALAAEHQGVALGHIQKAAEYVAGKSMAEHGSTGAPQQIDLTSSASACGGTAAAGTLDARVDAIRSGPALGVAPSAQRGHGHHGASTAEVAAPAETELPVATDRVAALGDIRKAAEYVAMNQRRAADRQSTKRPSTWNLQRDPPLPSAEASRARMGLLVCAPFIQPTCRV